MTRVTDGIFSPLGIDEFAAVNFGQQRLHLSGRDEYGMDILTIADVEELLLTLTSPADLSWLRLVRKGTTLPVVGQLLDRHGMINAPLLFERFARGFSIVINQVHRRSMQVRRLCADLEKELITATGIRLASETVANAYLSPPGQQAFRPHFDASDVFVIQLSGRKRWGLWPRTAEAPVISQDRLPVDPDRPAETAVLAPGDLLYLPSGIPHAAHTLPDDHSLHLTIAVWPVTRAAALRSAVNASTVLGDPANIHGGGVAFTLSPAEISQFAAELHGRALEGTPSTGGLLERLLQPPAEGDRLILRDTGDYDITDDGTEVAVAGRGFRRVFGGQEAEMIRCLRMRGEMAVDETMTSELASALVATGLAETAPRCVRQINREHGK